MQRAKKKKKTIQNRELAQVCGPERRIGLTIKGRKKLVSKFGLTVRRLGTASERLDRLKVNNCAGYAPLFCSMRKMFGSFKGKRILEVDSPTADFTTVLHSLGAKMTVMDRFEVNERAPIEGKQGEFEDVGRLFNGRNFDAIVSNWSLGNYRANNKIALEGILASLKSGGYLIVSTDRVGDIRREDLTQAGFKIILDASDLFSTYGLQNMLSGRSIFIPQKPIQKGRS